MTIEVTQDMIDAGLEALQRSDNFSVTPDARVDAVASVIHSALGVLERNFEVTLRPLNIPASVNLVTDRDGDSWYRLADGRWVCPSQEHFLQEETLKAYHGPLSWTESGS